MADTINLRAANETPVVESISDGDKALLVDANGVAKQLPANKLGGGGGGGGLLIYTTFAGEAVGSGEPTVAPAYKDPEMTQLYTYAELKDQFLHGVCIYVAATSEGATDYYAIYPTTLVPIEEYACLVVTGLIEDTFVGLMLCGSDAALG